MMDITANLSEMQEDIILRAFNGQFSIDDLENTEAEEIARVIQELQESSYGVVRKSA